MLGESLGPDFAPVEAPISHGVTLGRVAEFVTDHADDRHHGRIPARLGEWEVYLSDDLDDDEQPEATIHIITRLNSAEPVPPEILPANAETKLADRFMGMYRNPHCPKLTGTGPRNPPAPRLWAFAFPASRP